MSESDDNPTGGLVCVLGAAGACTGTRAPRAGATYNRVTIVAIRGAILGPSPVAYATVGLSFSAGVLDGEGVYLLRPSWFIDPYWAVEGFAGLSPRSEKGVFLGGLGFVLRMAPGAVVGRSTVVDLPAAAGATVTSVRICSTPAGRSTAWSARSAAHRAPPSVRTSTPGA